MFVGIEVIGNPHRRSGHVGSSALVAVVVLGAIGAAGIWWFTWGKGVASSADGHAPQTPWFTEAASACGIEFRHVVGPVKRFWFPEIMSGGVGLFDFDNDGYLDVYCVQGGDLDPSTSPKLGNRLFKNRGDGTFEDWTEQAGVGDTGYGMGCTCGDYDGDGHVDLYVTNVGPNVLYRNDGDGTFTDVTAEAGVGDPGMGSSAAFVDYDRDGDLDLYVVNYVNWSIERDIECYTGSGEPQYCSPNNYNAPAPDTLYRNNGDGTFTDVSESSGIRKVFGNGLGVACGDYNLDGWIDIYVTNDGMPNQLWLNTGDGRFRDDALALGCAVNISGSSEAGMGVAAVDVDDDSDLDLFMSHLGDETNTFYSNNGSWFEDTTATMGLGGPSIDFTGFGLGFADFNHDGRLDLYVVNGRVVRPNPLPDAGDIYAELNQLFSSDGVVFHEVMPRGGTTTPLIYTSRAAAFGDLDNDGDVDIVVVNNNAAIHVLRNGAAEGHWVMFRVLDRSGRYALHVPVRIDAGNGPQWRHVQRAYSYCASNDPRVHFGLGSYTQIDQVTVYWPGGEQEAFGAFAADAIYELRQGSGR